MTTATGDPTTEVRPTSTTYAGPGKLRSALERISRGIVLRRRLPATFGRGRIFVAPENGGLRYWRMDLSKVDPHLLQMVAELVEPGASVWDVGANVGLFTFAAAHRAGPTGNVLAIEPDVDNIQLLLRTRRAMDPASNAPVELLPAAIAAPGHRFAEFHIAVRSRSANALAGHGLTQAGGVRERRTVPLFTLDELLPRFRAPGVLKIDVEGAEIDLLAGATTVLDTVRPVILVEVDPANQQAVGDILRARRYRLGNADLPAPRPMDLTAAAWNTIALPE